jgi:uncharacterized protein (DUF362 family)
MSSKINRRDFIKGVAATGAAAYGLQFTGGNAFAQVEPNIQLSIAQGDLAKGAESELIKRVTRKSVEALGGMGKFVSKNSVVLVKPNIAWNRTPEQCANTNPYVVEAVVEMCREAGAKKVKVMDYTINPARMTYERSGIKAAVKRAKGDMEFVDDRKFKEKSIPEGVSLKSWQIYEEALDVDVFINIPIAKHHSLTKLTLGMKNIMGLILDRGAVHTRIDQKLADLSTILKPHLVIMDAYRVLTANGPNAGTPDDIKLVGQVIAGSDPVAVDSYASTIFGLTGEDIGYVKIGHEMGLGEIDLSKVKKIESTVA